MVQLSQQSPQNILCVHLQSLLVPTRSRRGGPSPFISAGRPLVETSWEQNAVLRGLSGPVTSTPHDVSEIGPRRVGGSTSLLFIAE